MKIVKYISALSMISLFIYDTTNAQPKNVETVTNVLKANNTVLIIAGLLLLFWLLLVIIYLVWAIHKYNENYGLSNHEWKVLYPDVYAKEKERDTYAQLKNNMISERQNLMNLKAPDGESPEIVTTPFDEPSDNPYKCDSFGLPPNTIRGIMALTALVLFVLMEGVNLFSTIKVEEYFTELTLALEMVLAFYFGSRAIEVLKARSKKDDSGGGIENKKKDETATGIAVTGGSEKKDIEAQTETSIIPEDKSSPRVISTLSTSNQFEDAKKEIGKFKGEKSIQNRPLNERVLALTASFETGNSFPECFAGLSDNFDGQGISFGALQWNIGQGSLQPLLKKMNDNYQDLCKDAFGSLYYDFDRMLNMNKAEQMAWAKSIQFNEMKNGRVIWHIDKNWIQSFKSLGLTDEMIQIQTDSVSVIYQKALQNAGEYELTCQRGVALMFDIVTQNGIVDRNGAGRRIKEDYMKLSGDLNSDEIQTERMIIIANRRAEVSRPAYIEDVRKRKMTIATGEGKVHSRKYNLREEFNLTLAAI